MLPNLHFIMPTKTILKETINQACVLYIFQINLRLILVSGKTKEFLFSPSDSAGDIAHHVFENWPEGRLFSDLVPSDITIKRICIDQLLHHRLQVI